MTSVTLRPPHHQALRLVLEVSQSPANLVRLARDEQVHPVMLPDELHVQVIFEALETGVDMSWNRYGCRLVLCRVDLDLVLEEVVVDIVC